VIKIASEANTENESETFDRDFWDQRWARALREHPGRIAGHQANAHLRAETGDLRPGLALDAGCGHGSDALWLATRGWQVTAVDFSVIALAHALASAESAGAEVAGRIEWTAGDLASWTPSPGRYDLVICLYVHVAGSVGEMVLRLAAGVAPGGTLLMVGHSPVDPATGDPTPAAGQVQVSVDDAVDALDPGEWRIVVAQERPRAVAGSGVDAVVRATRRAAAARSPVDLASPAQLAQPQAAGGASAPGPPQQRSFAGGSQQVVSASGTQHPGRAGSWSRIVAALACSWTRGVSVMSAMSRAPSARRG
jgi:SAM-dependent methyltransferase